MTTPTLALASLTPSSPAPRSGARRFGNRRPLPISAFAVVPRQRKTFPPAPEPVELDEPEGHAPFARRAVRALQSDLFSVFIEASDTLEFYTGAICMAVAAVMFNWFAVGLLLGATLDHPYGMLILVVGGVGIGGIGIQTVGNHRREIARLHRRICEFRTMMPEALPPERL